MFITVCQKVLIICDIGYLSPNLPLSMLSVDVARVATARGIRSISMVQHWKLCRICGAGKSIPLI